MKYSPRLLLKQYARKNGLVLALVVITGAGKSLLNILLSLFVGVFYSLHFGETTGKSDLLSSFGVRIDDLSSFFNWFLILLTFRMLSGALAYYLENSSGDAFVEFLRNLLFEQQMRRKLIPGEKVGTSRSLLKQSSEMSSVRSFLVKGILGFTSDLLFILGSIVLMSVLSPDLTLISVKVIVLAVVVSLLLGLLLRQAIQRKNDKRFDLLSFAENAFRNIQAIKLLNRERVESDVFIRKNNKYVSASKILNARNSLIEAWMPAVFFGLLGIILWSVSTSTQLSNTVGGGKLITFVLLLFYIQGSIRRILKTPGTWQKGLISFRSISLELNIPIERKTNEEVGRNSKGLIQVQNVLFGYQPEKPLFQNLNFSINGIGVTCITGKRGSGKSTLLKLLTNLFEPSSGEITLDGVKYSSLTAFGVRKKMAIMGHEVPLLGKTVFEAISFSQRQEKREGALKTLTELGVIAPGDSDEFLEEKMNQIHSKWTIRQLELARALLTRKDIILMDEPFEGLEAKDRQEMVKIINRLAYYKTIIIACSEPQEGLLIHKKIDLG